MLSSATHCSAENSVAILISVLRMKNSNCLCDIQTVNILIVPHRQSRRPGLTGAATMLTLAVELVKLRRKTPPG